MVLKVTNEQNQQQAGGSNLQQTSTQGLGPQSNLPSTPQAQQDQIAALLRSDADNTAPAKTKNFSGNIEQAILIVGVALVAVAILILYQRLALKFLKRKQ